MHVEKMNTTLISGPQSQRPLSFQDFIGQSHIVRILETAISGAHQHKHQLGHILLSGPSGYGKTTLARIIAGSYQKKFHIITAYAIVQAAELISLLTSLAEGDILFIDEIHRLKPAIEEILYIAMEDHAIDMVVGDGGSVRIPLKSFTLIGATTKPETLSQPLKNRFIYDFHCIDYTEEEKIKILERYLQTYHITHSRHILEALARKVDTTPRKIHNFVIVIRDYLAAHHQHFNLTDEIREQCNERLHITDGGLSAVHQQYMTILHSSKNALGLKTIALKLGINEESVENEIEPLLLKSGLIEKTSKGRRAT